MMPDIIEIKCPYSARDMTVSEAAQKLKDFPLGLFNSVVHSMMLIITCHRQFSHSFHIDANQKFGSLAKTVLGTSLGPAWHGSDDGSQTLSTESGINNPWTLSTLSQLVRDIGVVIDS